MDENTKIVDDAFSRFEGVINKFRVIERISRDLGTGEMINVGEIHMIAAVDKNPGINITKLSARLGITKGAVSQAVGKLENKNYLKRIKDPKNNKHVLVELTDRGKLVVIEHYRLHREIFATHMSDITFGQLAIFIEVLEKIEAFMDINIKNKKM